MKTLIFLCLLQAGTAWSADLGDISRRNLFRPLIAPAPKPPKIRIQAPVAPPPPPRIPLSQRASHLRLVGIMNTEPPQAIIEDQSSQKTVYVSAGQPIGDVRVDKITRDGVILAADEERLTLAM